jgi:hypothetical protein
MHTHVRAHIRHIYIHIQTYTGCTWKVCTNLGGQVLHSKTIHKVHINMHLQTLSFWVTALTELYKLSALWCIYKRYLHSMQTHRFVKQNESALPQNLPCLVHVRLCFYCGHSCIWSVSHPQTQSQENRDLGCNYVDLSLCAQDWPSVAHYNFCRYLTQFSTLGGKRQAKETLLLITYIQNSISHKYSAHLNYQSKYVYYHNFYHWWYCIISLYKRESPTRLKTLYLTIPSITFWIICNRIHSIEKLCN